MTDSSLPVLAHSRLFLPAIPVSAIGRSFRNHAPLYLMAVFTFTLSYPVSRIAGTRPDLQTVAVFGYHLGIAFGLASVLFLVWKLGRMILIEKPDSPTLELMSWVSAMVRKEGWMVGFVHTFVVVSLFTVGFGILKGRLPSSIRLSGITPSLRWIACCILAICHTSCFGH